MDKPELAKWRIVDFVRELAAGTPMPGGGCAVAVTGALAAALGALAAKISDKKRSETTEQQSLAPLIQELEAAHEELLELVDADALAYQEVVKALRLPRDSAPAQERRRQAVQAAFVVASRPPLALARWGLKLLEMALVLTQQGERVILADVGVMGYLAQAVVQGGLVNIWANLKMAPATDPEVTSLEQEAQELGERLTALAPRFAALLSQRLKGSA